MASKHPFGNPQTQAFEKQYLRWANFGDTRVRVHKSIWPLVNRILAALDQEGYDVSGATTVEDDLLRLSFRIPIPAEKVAELREQVDSAHFSLTDDGVFKFEGSAEEGETLSEQIGIAAETVTQESTDDEPVVADPVETRWGRALSIGDEGPDVLFIQHYTGAPATGQYDEVTADYVTRWQVKHWCDPTGEVNRETWLGIIPVRVGWLRPGATGPVVKALQAAFLALGVQAGPVTGVWGVRLSHSVRIFQEANGLPRRLRVGVPEFGLLFLGRDLLGVVEDFLDEPILVVSES